MNVARKGDDQFNSIVARLHRVCRHSKSWNKCFGIGSNKTATSSLDAIFKDILGFRTYQKMVETRSTIEFIQGNFEPFKNVMSDLDFHQDMPASQGYSYVALDALFPNSKFILTVREPTLWVNSMIKQYRVPFLDIASNSNLEGYIFSGYMQRTLDFFYQGPVKILKADTAKLTFKCRGDMHAYKFSQRFIDALISEYKHRNDSIVNYFRERPQDLLVIDLSKEKDTSNITNFLGFPSCFKAPMPLYNVTGYKAFEKETFSQIEFDVNTINQAERKITSSFAIVLCRKFISIRRRLKLKLEALICK